MKKFITGILFSISMFSFFILYTNYKETQIYNMKNAEHNLENSYSVLIPTKINSLPRGTQYDEFLNASTQSCSSIFFTRIDQDGDDEKIIKYVLLNDDTYMNSLTLIKGKPLDKSLMGTNYFLSTEDTGDPNQIGQIASFDGIKMEIRTLQSILDDGYFVDGYCTITMSEGKDIDSFIDIFKNAIGAESIEVSDSINVANTEESYTLQIAVLFIIFALLILYYILKSYKKIAIEKMLGYSLVTIWKKRIIKILSLQIFTMAFSIIVMSLVLFKDFNTLYFSFYKYLLTNYLYLIIITLAVATIPFIYIKRIKITSLIKNKKQVKEIILFNTFIKIILCVFFIFLIDKQMSEYQNIQKVFDDTYASWENVSDYRVLNLTRLTEELAYSDSYINNNIEIYKYFNERNAIFADFNQYTVLSRTLNKNMPVTSIYAMVNPNYLIDNPVYDSNGNLISISEDNPNWILLIPEQYIDDEEDIQSYYNLWMDTYDFSDEVKLEIIWTKSGQELFSYNFAVNPNEGNYVTDPVLFVGTESGGIPTWNFQIFNIEGNPFKVKIESGKVAEEVILPILNEYGYNSYGIQINYANEQVASNYKDYKDLFTLLITAIISTALVLLIILLENTYNFFEQYQTRFALRQLHGYGKLKKYKEYITSISLSWGIIFIISTILKLSNIGIIISFSLVGFLIETILSLITLSINENKKIIKLIKGGI